MRKDPGHSRPGNTLETWKGECEESSVGGGCEGWRQEMGEILAAGGRLRNCRETSPVALKLYEWGMERNNQVEIHTGHRWRVKSRSA